MSNTSWKTGPWHGYTATPEVLQFTGRIALSWGVIDRLITLYISTFLLKTKSPIGPYDRLNFRKRKNIFLQELRKAHSDCNLSIVEAFETVMAEVATLSWKRNILLHGHVYGMVDEAENQFVIATGTHKSKEVTLQLKEKDLEELALRIEHAAALLCRPAMLPNIASPDIPQLQDLDMYIFRQSLPNPPKPRPPSRPSRE